MIDIQNFCKLNNYYNNVSTHLKPKTDVAESLEQSRKRFNLLNNFLVFATVTKEIFIRQHFGLLLTMQMDCEENTYSYVIVPHLFRILK